MPQYVIEREIPGAGNLSDEALQEISKKSVNVLNEMGPEIKWLHSYVTGDKVYCVYLAPDEESIRRRCHTTWTAIDGLRTYSWRGERLSLPEVKSMLKEWAR